MRDADLQSILKDIEQVAAAAEQLLRASRSSDAANGATRPLHPAGAGSNQLDAIMNTTRGYLRSSPWRTLGIATGLGFLVGCMLTGGSRHRKPRE